LFGYITIDISFHHRQCNTDNYDKVFICSVVIPEKWCDNMFLGLLNWSITQNGLISIENIVDTFTGMNYTTVNESNNLYKMERGEITNYIYSHDTMLVDSNGKYQMTINF
jgi:hypothetical protein